MKQSRTALLGAVLGTALATSAFGQGEDNCANATPISGTGDWNFLLFTATTDGSPDGVCNFFGQDQIENDVWFAWTATQTGMVDIDTCDNSTVDTKMAIYDGTSCSGSPIACNDDSCNLQSAVDFMATSGNTYLIRVGTYPGAAVGGGQIHVEEAGSGGGGGNGGANDCANAQVIGGTGTFDFDNSAATTDGAADGLCNFFGQTQIDNDVWFLWTAPIDETFELSTCGAGFDTKIAVYAGASCSGSPIACNDDDCGLQSTVEFSAFAGNQYLLRLGTYPGVAGGVATFDLDVSGTTGGGGGCSNPASGPDVIIGEMPSVQNYGGLNGMSSFAIGTTSCNVGDAELLWIASNNQHPVIGQNIYRLENGRFEMIGMGWLKHGFTALQGNVCCTCNSSGTGSRLGVGCSDPYSASLNGVQPSLGPRSEINAFTGDFPYPFINGFNQGGDQNFKRIQVQNSDLDPATRPSAEFFGEGHYVTPDDAASGNGKNNASYRPMSVTGASGSGFNMTMNGVTVRTAPAIQAWQDTDATVNLVDVLIPGEGLFKVASNAYDNGDGTWRYEYAVYNLDSDFSGESFSIPTGAGVTVTDIGMSFPLYHSGEPYSNTAWTSSVSGSAVTFSTESFMMNQNANALRWGTLYSFWFTANAAPVNSDATIGLFKPGNPGDQLADVKRPGDGPGTTGPVVTNYCPGNANSTGVGAEISALNINLGAASMTLEATNLPNNSAGYFLNSPAQAFLANPGGSAGNICLGNPIGRFLAQVQNSGAGSSFSIPVDLNALPRPTGFATVMAGDTWNFQCWYRDSLAGIATSNFTNGVEVLFQ